MSTDTASKVGIDAMNAAFERIDSPVRIVPGAVLQYAWDLIDPEAHYLISGDGGPLLGRLTAAGEVQLFSDAAVALWREAETVPTR